MTVVLEAHDATASIGVLFSAGLLAELALQAFDGVTVPGAAASDGEIVTVALEGLDATAIGTAITSDGAIAELALAALDATCATGVFSAGTLAEMSLDAHLATVEPGAIVSEGTLATMALEALDAAALAGAVTSDGSLAESVLQPHDGSVVPGAVTSDGALAELGLEVHDGAVVGGAATSDALLVAVVLEPHDATVAPGAVTSNGALPTMATEALSATCDAGVTEVFSDGALAELTLAAHDASTAPGAMTSDGALAELTLAGHDATVSSGSGWELNDITDLERRWSAREDVTTSGSDVTSILEQLTGDGDDEMTRSWSPYLQYTASNSDFNDTPSIGHASLEHEANLIHDGSTTVSQPTTYILCVYIYSNATEWTYFLQGSGHQITWYTTKWRMWAGSGWVAPTQTTQKGVALCAIFTINGASSSVLEIEADGSEWEETLSNPGTNSQTGFALGDYPNGGGCPFEATDVLMLDGTLSTSDEEAFRENHLQAVLGFDLGY